MSIHVPHIINYMPFYLQTKVDERAVDTKEYGLIAKSTPYPALPTPKDPYKNTWHDEDGDEEYNEVMHYESFELSVSFYLKTFDDAEGTSEKSMRRQLDSFFSKIRQGEFMIYDSYLGLGFSGVRYSGFKEDSIKRRKNWTRVIFSVTFKVNNPLSRVVLNANNVLVEE